MIIMGTKNWKLKIAPAPLSTEEWDVRYDILRHSLWIIFRYLLLLNMLWFLMLLKVGGYGSWQEVLGKIIFTPMLLFGVAGTFVTCYGRFRLPLNDHIVLLILNLTILLVVATDRWTYSLQVMCIVPIIFGLFIGSERLIFFQAVVSMAMMIGHYFIIDLDSLPKGRNRIVLDISGLAFDILVIAHLIVQIRKYTQMLDTQTMTDSLTRLHNHEAFYEELNRRMEEYRVQPGPLSILIADIDNFKKVNDTYGHAYGDRVLKALAGIFLEETGKKCFAARYGGEEFAMIMERDRIDAITKAESIRRHFEQKIIPTDSGIENSFTISIGIAVYNPQYETSSQFFEMADEALYHAKASGKNRVCIK